MADPVITSNMANFLYAIIIAAVFSIFCTIGVQTETALEALIGAIYLDKGYKKSEQFILKQLFETHVVIEDVLEKETDFKSLK